MLKKISGLRTVSSLSDDEASDEFDDDFEQYKQGFIVKNTAGDTQKCLRLLAAPVPKPPIPPTLPDDFSDVDLNKLL